MMIKTLFFVLTLLPFTLLGKEQHARWLSNTFRIDPSIKEVTLFIERESSSVPVVLIKPDGSKLYYQRHPDNVSWASTPERDVITLWKPQPGPWQATGKIAGEHGITLLSVFHLQMDALPTRVFQNEVIQLNGQLAYKNTTLDANYYLDGLSLKALLYAEDNNADKDAFSLAPLELGTFKDDGTGADTLPGDGIMTAEIIFDALPGNYLFQAEISNGVLARYVQNKVLLYPQPVRARFTTPDSSRQWRLEFETDSDVLVDSLTITGELINPLEQSVAISGQGRSIDLPPALQPGNYRWRGRAYVTTMDGREIQIKLKDQVVRVVPPLPGPDENHTLAATSFPLWQQWWLWASVALALMLTVAGVWWWRSRKGH
ncbi:choice-of-anchor X domain-containing protein, partial [Oceanimonas baumannii]|uniref:choice-of-anchor X domain-containing protein n=1 Tax=Oceanimonas baumannii TaxID=129578 RepID=UPI003A95D644